MGSPIASITPGCAISRLIRSRFLSRENTVCIDEHTRRSCARYTLSRGLDVPWKIRNLSQPLRAIWFLDRKTLLCPGRNFGQENTLDQRRFYDTKYRTKTTIISSKIISHISDNDIYIRLDELYVFQFSRARNIFNIPSRLQRYQVEIRLWKVHLNVSKSYCPRIIKTVRFISVIIL